MKSFQEIITTLQTYWSSHGCALLQSYDMEVGAGTFHPDTVLRALGPDRWRAAHVQLSRRPTDGRYGDNPNRVQRFHQFQVVLKPSPDNIQQMYLESLESLGLSSSKHDIRFVEDDWESPTLGASGLGWEVWCDGMEVTQFTYFQQMGGMECFPITVEIAYGLERLAMLVQNVDNFYDINWNGMHGVDKITYRDVCHRLEAEFSAYNFDYADTEILDKHFFDCEKECESLLEKGLSLPAYDQCIKASHLFNILDARGSISVAERAARIAKIRSLAKACCEVWLDKRYV